MTANDMTLCEFCGAEVRADEFMKCRYCGKFVCFDCSFYLGVRINAYPRTRLSTVRVCPNCKPQKTVSKPKTI